MRCFFAYDKKNIIDFVTQAVTREGRTIKTEEQTGIPEYVNTKIIAKCFGITVRRVQQLTQEGIIETKAVPKKGRCYEFETTIKTYIRHLSDKAYGKNKSAKAELLKEQKLEAEIALKELQGELHRIKCEIAAGKYIDVEEVSMDYQKFFAVFKRFAMGMPARLVSMASDSLETLEARRIEKELGEEVKRMLKAFVVAGALEKTGTGEKKEDG